MKRLSLVFLSLMLLVTACANEDITPDPVSEATMAPVTEAATESSVAETVTEAETSTVAEEPFVVTFEPDPEGLSALATANGIHIGAAIDLKYNSIEAYKTIMTNEFNTIVMENMMKWATTNPAEDRYLYSGADVAAYIAKEHGMKMRGHALVWHSQLPDWVTKKSDTWTKDELLDTIEKYVTNVAGHFRGSVYSWDVLNEVIEDDGSFRESLFYRVTGQDYIRLALETARKADPDARLLINDYSVETLNPKSDALYKLVKELKEEGVPLDGVGFQCHLVLGETDFESMEANIQRFQDLGLVVELTEIDIRIEAPFGEEELLEQKAEYKQLMTLALDNNIDTFVVWGIHDGHTWVDMWFPGFSSPLLFDKLYKKKPSYEGVVEALKEHQVQQ